MEKVYFAKNLDKKQEIEPIIPTKANPQDAGYDLYATNSYNIYPGELQLIDTGIHAAIPDGYYGRVADRSGMSVKGSRVGAGVVDSGYRGEIKVLLQNMNEHGVISIKAGDKVAQLIITKILESEAVCVNLNELPNSARGDKGFGSSGR